MYNSIYMNIPNRDEFIRGYEEFEKHEKRDAMYKVASFLLEHFWGSPPKMADGLGVLLLTWNQAFYRYGSFDFEKLEKCIAENIEIIEHYRERDISELSIDDESCIKVLFEQFLEALKIDSGKKGGTKSPVAVAKALHLLAPGFFPLWDYKIALEYKCYYGHNAAKQYVQFCNLMQGLADKVRSYTNRTDKTLVKLIDEYNYAKFTQGWI